MTRFTRGRFSTFLVICLIAPFCAVAEDPPISRSSFARLMAKVNQGMDPNQVLAILGKPDDIWTLNDRGGLGDMRSKEVWCYGSGSHLAFPTLGRVTFGKDDRVLSIIGGSGTPPSSEVINESTLRGILELIDQVPWIEFGPRKREYNPLDMIRVVNALQPLGKDRAFAVLDEYSRLNSYDVEFGPPQNVVLVALALFEPVKDESPPSLFLPWEEYRDQFPHYPIVYRDDVPLFVFPLGGYGRTGPPTPTRPTMQYFRGKGQMRGRSLTPPDQPISILDRFSESTDWVFKSDGQRSQAEAAQELIVNQLLRLVETVYELEPNAYGHKLSMPCDGRTFDQAWQEHKAVIAGLQVKWDTARTMYTFVQGEHFEQAAQLGDRLDWDLSKPGRDVHLIIERRNSRFVEVRVVYDIDEGAMVQPDASIEVFSANDESNVLCTFPYPGQVTRSQGGSSMKGVELVEGERVQARMVVGPAIVRSSDVFEP